MRRSLLVLAIAGLLVGAMAAPALARGKGNPHPTTTVYVTGQSLTYDTIVPITPDKGLPFNGKDNWQLLEMGDHGLQTEFGPGDPGYFGGRWFMDMDGDRQPSEGDVFFLCPLLGPGYQT